VPSFVGFRFFMIGLTLAFVVGMAAGQKRTCDLSVKVFSYDALDSKANRLVNGSVHLKGQGVDQTLKWTGDTANDRFKNLNEGRYILEFEKSKYKKRAKQVELDCSLAGDSNEVWTYVYLWQEKKGLAADGDLIEDEKHDVDKTAKKDGGEASPDSVNKIFGKVSLKMFIDEDGNVVSATPIAGEKKLFDKAVKMALRAKFSPSLMAGIPVKVTGNIVYNFAP
jgi:hypothetical protein